MKFHQGVKFGMTVPQIYQLKFGNLHVQLENSSEMGSSIPSNLKNMHLERIFINCPNFFDFLSFMFIYINKLLNTHEGLSEDA